MIRSRFFHLLALFLLTQSAGWTQQKLNTAISDVTVYTDRAAITRSGEIYLNPGEYQFVVSDLPHALQDQSLRVGGSGTAMARISDIKIELDYIDTMPQNRLKDLQDQLALLMQDERVFNDRLGLLGKEKELLDQIKNSITQNKESNKLSFDDWSKLFGFYDANYNKLNDEIRTLEKKRGDLTVRKNALQNQINQLSGYGKLVKKKVFLTVNVSKPGMMNFAVDYVIGGAKWYPVYDVRVSPEDKSVDMTYYAMIAQRTGEDWSNVNLAISTARPNVSGSMPQLSAWYLSVYQPIGILGRGGRSGAGMGAMSSAKMAKSAEEISDMNASGGAGEVPEEAEAPIYEMETDEAAIETKSTSVVFKIKRKTNIPSDNYDHKVTITSESLKSDFAYSSVPKLAELVYLRASIENTTEAPFLAGNANVFFGSNFVGTTYLNTVIPTEKFDVSLGIDDGIRIKRQQIRDYNAEKGVFNKSVKKTFEYKITIESFKRTDDTILVVDQFPQSQDERIKVEAVLPEFPKEKWSSPHPNGVIEKTGGGLVQWRLRIKPKEKIELRIKYVVEYPRDVKVDGL
ncbi:mucoidy inhibitor MuiA family protein [bacterium]|nr:mucoidy inhibitor MuiA family protein [bacterium]NUN46551.1 mucoidy inhibitor MuiA family protein [bacterium]